MASYGDVRKWQSGPLLAAERNLKRSGDKILGLADELDLSGCPQGWEGRDADAARARLGKIIGQGKDISAAAAAARKAFGDAGDAIENLQRAVTDTDGIAKAHDMRIANDGSVVGLTDAPENVPGDQAESVAAERARVKAELTDRVNEIVRRAGEISAELVGVLSRVTSGEINGSWAPGLQGAAVKGLAQAGWAFGISEPPEGGSPAANRAWWDTLSDEDRRILIDNFPAVIGNLDGIPFAQRAEANQNRLETEYATLKAQLDALGDGARISKVLTDGSLQFQVQDALGEVLTGNKIEPAVHAEIAAIQAKLDSLDVLGGLADRGRGIVTLDLSGERAEAAVANGDLDTADRVAVFTPGFTSTVDGSMERYDDDMRQMKLRTEEILERQDSGDTVATVVWLGYQAPQATLEGIRGPDGSVLADNAALAGSDKLASFYHGIDAGRPDNAPELTAVGHSYGWLTTGHALQHGTGVDAAVDFGGPGSGTRDMNDLKVPGDKVYVLNTDDDLVPWLGGELMPFGGNPARLDGVTVGETGDAIDPQTGMSLEGVTGHSAYLQEGSTSQHNIASVIAGYEEGFINDR